MLELLSPAGSMEALRAAVQNGANAVYLGYDRFNARMGAQNFSADELQEAIVYCHVRGVQVHLTLNTLVSDREMARAAEAGGADALSMINTITGMKIDIHRRCFALANRTGGMSGPAVHPVAVRMVYQSAQAVKIPIIGMGGIQKAEDAIEMILAGATAVSVGTANFYHPHATEEIVDGIRAYMERYQVEDIRELIGAVHDR